MRFLASSTVAFFLLCPLAFAQDKNAAPKEGVLPVGGDGKPLNLDFETGTLKDWTAEGEAFADQPIKGDTVHPRRGDNKSQHQGDYWIGGFEKHGDKPQGTLTSVPFKVTHPWASFLVGGGPHDVTCVELVRKDTGKVFHRASGYEEENLRREVIDLKPHLEKEIFIRIVDRHSGHWGHINFDDFRFHSEKPNYPKRPVMQPPAALDQFKFAGLPPKKAAQVMTVPEGFNVTLFAGEPDVVQPIAMCLDDRGRVWVAEGRCYPIRRKAKGPDSPFVTDGVEGDRILIFEDTDGDGVFDKRTVFMDGLNLVSGLEVGFGGVWIGAAPYLLYVPMKDDKPGEPKVLLDGWGAQDTHETLNGFIWGPDGWLYGCHGVFTHSLIGRPGEANAKRIPLNAGVWRYHPTRHVFEVFAHGTSNPWGLDFNEYGQAFISSCVIPHCFHIVQGGRYQRQAGEHFNKHTYADIQTIADHQHWQGPNQWAANNRSDAQGGGHAHCGLMCYLGGTWPKEYHGQLFMGNIHGRRLNMDILKAKGSGYTASHGPDFLLANDAHARFINMRYGPDGNVYVIDWYDKQACHTGEVKIWDRTSGRIYKISHRATKPVQVDLSKKSDKELVELQLDENEWHVRHARRLLQERAATGKVDEMATERLRAIATKARHPIYRVRGLWALHATRSLKRDLMETTLADKDDFVRGWAIQLAREERGNELITMNELEALSTDDSPVVRRYLASALLGMGIDEREAIVGRLLNGDEPDEHGADPNIPLLYWYALEPLAGARDHRRKALEMALKTKIAPLLSFTVRRMASDVDDDSEVMPLLVSNLQTSATDQQLIFLRAMNQALKGRRNVPMPKTWSDVFSQLAESKNQEVRTEAVALAVSFGDVRAFADMRRLVADPKSDLSLRANALTTLIAARDKDLPPLLHGLVADPALRREALRGLAAFDDAKTPEMVLGAYKNFNLDEKRDALNTLASRPVYALALFDAVAAKKVPAGDVSAEIVRQLRNLRNKDLDKRIAEVWGVVRDTPAERAKLIADTKRGLLSAGPNGDPHLGRAMFAKTCAQCHMLFGVGAKIGPDITGANRASLDYLLENILDPSAVIPKEYTATLVELSDGRVLTGLVRNETKATITVHTANDTLTIPRGDIASLKATSVSMMPDDLVAKLSPRELRSLIAYLQSPTQTPLLASADNAKDFWSGKDLTGWDGDPKLWRVEQGEIVGKTDGLKHNEFLKSHMSVGDFKLSLKVKLTPNKENSGVQFRSEVLPAGDVKGLQADIGEGWWGKLYDEHGRGLLWDKSGEKHVKADDWNDYVIEAQGSRIRTWLNGNLCVDYEDLTGPRRGIFALQLHSGGPMEVRFKELRLEVR